MPRTVPGEAAVGVFDAWVELVRDALPGGEGAPRPPDEARRRALRIWTHLHGFAVLAANHSLDLVAGMLDPAELLRESIRAHLGQPGLGEGEAL